MSDMILDMVRRKQKVNCLTHTALQRAFYYKLYSYIIVEAMLLRSVHPKTLNNIPSVKQIDNLNQV